ncbi:MAG: hypothetical protein Alis3KO_20030 [Aliiglaciecola sp.]|uniref:cbb3-type cytochrome oxidase assembly protein CcoS n=1 Tax=Aliiglaciecola sp. M165 TaxID=2593649 RepID=UPI00117FBAF9|nr:cbb3-type cytochrome oxidase assembly protein CcoS [Aliiglaciecola sp. M165]TRY30114.1 cbb3-type cytochrome oxidase assembly protein CcoS [Aliiglaciecola sp. M165]
MSIIYVLIPIAIVLVLIAIGVFFWAVKSDQFEDLERQGYNILFDDDLEKQPKASLDATINLQNAEKSINTEIKDKTDDKPPSAL